MANTTNLQLPLMASAQSQKHVTHNEALLELDTVVQLAVKSTILTTPPTSPTDGDRYIIASGATGAWAGKDLNITYSSSGAWVFLTPRKGWLCWDEINSQLLVWTGSAWTSNFITTTTILGIGGATADNTNRLSANTPAVLLNNAGTSISLTMNKNATANDASVTFQTSFSTKAIFGLLATDDLTFKVTPNGSNYYASIRAHNLLYGRTSIKNNERRIYQIWHPRINSASIDQIGLTASNTGTLNAVTPSASNLFTQSPRVKVTSAASAGASASLYGSGLYLWRGNATDMGGFYVRMVAGIETFQTSSRMFIGLYSSTSVIGNVNPSTLLNIIGVGFDSSDTTLSIINNDGTTGAVKTSLGAGFPTTGSQDMYELILAAEPNSSEIKYRVERLNGGNIAEGSITTRLPINTQFLTPHFWYNTGTATGAVELAVHSLYTENASMLGSRGLIT